MMQMGQQAFGSLSQGDLGSLDDNFSIPGVGWAPGFGPNAAAEDLYRQLRADWEAFERVGVGTTILPHLKPDLDAWRKFRDSWEGQPSAPWSSDDYLPGNEVGAKLDVQANTANRVRAELIQKQTGKFTAPVDLPKDQARKGLGTDESTTFLKGAATSIDSWARDVPGLGWLTDPKAPPGSRPARTLAVVAAVVAAGVLGFGALSRRGGTTVVVRR